MKKKVLFVCVHNSARSQMAEAFLKKYGEDKYKVESAGLEPGELNLLVVEVMAEEGIDISENETDSVFEFYKQNKKYDYVVTVCDESNSERCPMFPGDSKKLHWPFPNPSKFEGTKEKKLKKVRKVKNEIKKKVKNWVKDNN